MPQTHQMSACTMSSHCEGLSTFPEFLLNEQALQALKWLAPQGLNSVECVYHVGLDKRVFIRPIQEIC
jgi:hypothetical protein